MPLRSIQRSWGGTTASETGRIAEDASAQFLQQQGVQLLRRNYRGPSGEIDLIGIDVDTVCFVEVRARKNDKFLNPVASISSGKQRRIVDTARYFISQQPFAGISGNPCRFDVIVLIYQRVHGPLLTWYKDAFRVPSSLQS